MFREARGHACWRECSVGESVVLGECSVERVEYCGEWSVGDSGVLVGVQYWRECTIGKMFTRSFCEPAQAKDIKYGLKDVNKALLCMFLRASGYIVSYVSRITPSFMQH
jgi:hypothetical protein